MHLIKNSKKRLAFVVSLALCMFNMSYAAEITNDLAVTNQAETISNEIEICQAPAAIESMLESDDALNATDGVVRADEETEVELENVIKENETQEITTTGGVEVEETTAPGLGVDFISTNTVVQNTLGTEYSGYMYKFVIDTPTKLAVLVNTEKTLDADVYIYNSEFEIVAASEKAGAGVEEVINYIAEAGEYYIFVNGYEGQGNYLVEFYASTSDVAYEMNDSLEEATSVENLFEVTGMIDNPYDMDVYKTTLNKPQHMIINLSNNAKSEYQVYLTQNGEGFYKATPGEAVSIPAGEWYFIVISEEGKYDLVNTYTLSTTAVKDAKYEYNDELDSAYNVGNNFSVAGILDSANDVDIYKMNLAKAAHINLGFYAQGDYTLNLTQDGTNFYGFQGEEDVLALPAGTWYFYVSSPSKAYSLTDEYVLFANTVKDAEYEINDSLEQAYPVNNNFTVNGIIDCANDIDIYKSTFSEANTRVNIDFIDASGNGYQLYASQDGKSYYDLTTADAIKLPAAGTWYFYVITPEGKSDLNATYTLRCRVLDPLATDLKITSYGGGDYFQDIYRIPNRGYLTVNGKVTANGVPLANKKVHLKWWDPTWNEWTGDETSATVEADGYTNAAGEFSITIKTTGVALGSAGSTSSQYYTHDYDASYVYLTVLDGSNTGAFDMILYYSTH